uniref:SpoU_methylase domain-containing protein n=1 Tax=Loa loa TaxID=7209 RepID=A0A1I7VWS4_LOALO
MSGEHLEGQEGKLDLLLFDNAVVDEMETMVFALFAIVKRALPDINDRVEKIVHRFMCYGQSRFVRKAALSALHELKTNAVWKDYFIVMDVLEEPQFHLVEPVLPIFDRILCMCKATMECDGCLPWFWVQLLFVRTLNHPNGWIRVWAVQKIFSIDAALLKTDYSIILSSVLAALSNSDIYWRLYEDAKLNIFIKGFGSFLEHIASAGSRDDEMQHRLIQSIERNVGSTCFVFFRVICFCPREISEIKYCIPAPIYSDCSALCRPVLNAVLRMPCFPLRICTTANFLKFFFKLTERNWHEAHCFASLLSELPENKYGFLLEEFFYNTTFTETFADDMLEKLEGLQRSYALDHGQAYKVAMEVLCSLLAVDSYYSVRDFKVVDIILQLYTVISDDKLFEREESQYFRYALIAYLDTRLFTDMNEVFDPLLFNALHKKLLEMLDDVNFEHWLLRSMLLCNKTTLLSRRAALSSVAVAVISKYHDISRTAWNAVLNFLLAEENDSKASSATSRMAVFGETIAQNKSVLWQFFIADHSFDSVSIFKFCINSLKIFFSWDCRRAFLDLLLAVLKKAPTSSMIDESIETVLAVAAEEKKTLNYISVISDVLTICTLECALHTQKVAKIALKAVEKLYAESEQNVQIAVILADALYQARKLLCTTWFSLLIKMCAFGPVCKKDTLVLNLAVQMAYTMTNSLPTSNYEKLHECAQYSRLRALQTVSWICKNRCGSTDKFIQETFLMMKILDTMKNKSFGLSLAHRQKTRLLQLLLLIYGFASEEILEKLELFCIECLKDPSQQPSVRLVVSWILVRLYCNNEVAFQKFIGIEKELAAARIGSIGSWIVILMHVTKISRTDVAFIRCFTLLHPWCTAQNFTVRCTSLAALRLLWNIAGNKLRNQFDYLRCIIEFDMEKAGNTKRIIDNLCNDFYFAYLDENADYSLETVLTILPEKVGLTAQDVITANLLENISTEDFACTRRNSNNLSQYSSFIFGQTQLQRQQQIQEPDSISDTSVIQRKFNTVNVNRTCLESVSLIVVASLLDKAANLGGICRTCEVLGVEKLIVADLSKIKDRNFMALSMSSENWMNLEQSRPEELSNLLLSFRDSGYVIIGAEQTTNSTPLHKIRLPSKMVLLLGNEKGGIPMDLLGYLDKTVEVVQIGHTRSLNVHVTGALFIYRFFEEFIATKT